MKGNGQFHVAFVMFIMILLLAACGSSSTEGGTGSTEQEGNDSETSGQEVSEQEGEAEGKLAEILERGSIIIATSGNNAPTIFPNEQNELVGIDADWAQIIADHLGVEIDWRRMDFKGLIPGVTAGNFDIAMSGINVTEERLEALYFSDHYAFDEVVAVFPESTTDIHSPEDITDRVVGVVAGSTNGEAPAEEIGGYKELKSYPGLAEALHDLKNGRTEVVITGKMLAGHWIQTEGEGFTTSEEGLNGREVAVALNKGEDDLKAAIDEAIQNAKEQGKYEEIAEKWLGTTFSE
ncbi:substrate-binding periplasmic protein [Halalkalibacter oceani]|uniref:substrate-binding periplasmic protein n=1 Tax=Halalkalibacter oceani TaxID=1653776 RepID=UPI00339567E3